MNVYVIRIWRGVSRNGEFIHNATREVLVHALNEERAKKRITLAPEKTYNEKYEVHFSAEYIYSIDKTGTVKKKLYYEYSDGRNPRPVKLALKKEGK